MNAENKAEESLNPESTYQQRIAEYLLLPNALWFVAILSLAGVAILWLAIPRLCIFSIMRQRFLVADTNMRLMFLSYFGVLVSMWTVYFASGHGYRLATLRKLLYHVSDQWQAGQTSAAGAESYTNGTRDKARASMTMLSILTAAAALLMSHALDGPATTAGGDDWAVMLRYATAGFSLIALVCFIISVDSLDVLFNRFGGEDQQAGAHMIHFIYLNTRNTRYYGIMFLLWAVCIYAASFHLLFGTFAVTVVVSVGWSHWFPKPPAYDPNTAPAAAGGPVWVAYMVRAVFIVSPFIWMVFL